MRISDWSSDVCSADLIAEAGPATIGDARELYGTVELDPSARSEIRGQFPGRIVSVTKQVGDTVRRGELLARIESSESLQVYPVYSTVSGVVAERGGNPGDRSEEHTSELQSLMRNSYTVMCLKKK